ncbi:MAG: SGNH/GDSL hydrolase family protein, partial [Clostridia bacterium]|nr:SGNH/GDSL hydrolase family protein [Clostridia bacterium]
MKKKLIAALLLVVMLVPLFSFASFAKTEPVSKKVKVVTSLGDSASSGFGLPDYNRHGKQILYGERIKDSYPDLVTRKLGAETLHPFGISGIRTYDLRYLLDSDFEADYILKDVMGYMSEG